MFFSVNKDTEAPEENKPIDAIWIIRACLPGWMVRHAHHSTRRCAWRTLQLRG